MRFQHECHRQSVYFGTGGAAAGVADALGRLGAQRVMVIASPRASTVASQVTADAPVAYFHNEVTMHVPVEAADRARTAASAHGVDALVSVGGGSATGLAKAVALTSGLPIVAVPTTYSGSEATTIWGLTDDNGKTTGTDPAVLPRAVVYDAALTMSLSVSASVASGLNALAHCVDAMWAPRADPINRTLAAEGIRALRGGLTAIVDDPSDQPGRERTLYATYLSGVALSSAGSGLHHKICHVLGGAYNLPHARTHAIVLPYVLAFNAPAALDAARRIGTALGDATDCTAALARLHERLGPPGTLGDIGFHESDIDDAVTAILPVVPPTNPRAVTADAMRKLLIAASRGTPPTDISRMP